MSRRVVRKIYDDDGTEMFEGAAVLVNFAFERIIHFDPHGEIAVSDWHPDDTIYSIEKLPDDRYGELDDKFLTFP